MCASRARHNVAGMITNTHLHPLHVLIAGGGVAALEAMMALRALAGDRVRITLLAPDREFSYRPMAVAEPFAIAHAWRTPLAGIAADFGAQLVTGALDSVDSAEHCVVTRAGERIGYDALVIACGTRIRPAFEDALTIDDRTLGPTLRGLVQDVEEGYTREIAFVAPEQAFWPLPLYELALLTAHRAHDMSVAVDISIVSTETAPLTLFGSGISTELCRLLHDAGIAFHGSSSAQLADGQLTLQPSGRRLRGRVVALPLLDGPQIAGVPADAHGFIDVGKHGEVRGLDGVYAAGDATSYPIKHGGLAAQQADAVAATIAALAGVEIDAPPLRPVIRGALLTGHETCFFEAERVGEAGVSSTVSDICPWDPPAKIVARHLGPYLADGKGRMGRRPSSLLAS
jgi:sulfide:quinone oxidoreductase